MPLEIAVTATRTVSESAPKLPAHQQLRDHIKRQKYHLPQTSLSFLEQRLNDSQIIPLLDYLWLAAGGQNTKITKVLNLVPGLLEKGKTIEQISADLSATANWSALFGYHTIEALPYLWNEGFNAPAINLYFRGVIEIAIGRKCATEALKVLPHALQAGLNSFQSFNMIRGIIKRFKDDAAKVFELLCRNPEKLRTANPYGICAALNISRSDLEEASRSFAKISKFKLALIPENLSLIPENDNCS